MSKRRDFLALVFISKSISKKLLNKQKEHNNLQTFCKSLPPSSSRTKLGEDHFSL